MACDDITQLREQLEDLPRELYDWIYKLTFTVNSGFVKISKTGRDGPKDSPRPSPFPNLLHVSRASRSLYASKYYAQSIFVLRDSRVGNDWLRSVPDEHMEHMQDVRCLWPGMMGTSAPGSIDANFSTNAGLLQPTNDIVLELRKINNLFQARTLYETGPRGMISMFISEEEVGPTAPLLDSGANVLE